jgi:hypothetical protein
MRENDKLENLVVTMPRRLAQVMEKVQDTIKFSKYTDKRFFPTLLMFMGPE